MRSRIHISELTKDKQVDLNDPKLRDVILYSPDYKCVYLNGIRYGSLNEIKDTILSFSEIYIDKTCSIRLRQLLTSELNLDSNSLNGINRSLTMHKGDRKQLEFIPIDVKYSNNTIYVWRVDNTNNNFDEDDPQVLIDANNIVTARRICKNVVFKYVPYNDSDLSNYIYQYTITVVDYVRN